MSLPGSGAVPPREIDPDTMRKVLGHYPTGVVVVTAVHGGEPVGMAVGSFTSVSLRPALVGFFPDSSSTTWPRIREAGAFCVNVLGEDHQDVCRLFATRGADKFGALSWEPGPTGSPVLRQAISWIDCTLENVQEAGDHFLALGRVVDLSARSGGGPLIFYRGGYGGLRLAS
ncbi:NADH-FMN oxidoreductase RutF, flavin reductase (DIM6/NTAB) family [Thermomonospora echinospora]|uniref:NADH-FMN oxidoreductase RutF, flavin reductase (DIM6/NTAB) family n=1 Tax=Thermomonospora echinospora TaxID=1992 RepID=A0A1H6BZK2_9ACTN|nr:flavin reductase family protein [Thermomonospora echinospora]SEG66092.1 NADH-FMN oxidoreductase RutF, flavin reductase (DIM6/NTAB) family [Thermomonospora echinospora]